MVLPKLSQTAFQPKVEPKPLSTQEQISRNIKFHSNIAKEYANFLQQIESKDRATVMTEVNKLVNAMVEEHKFGTKFVQEVHKHINSIFSRPSAVIVESIKKQTGLTDDDYVVMSNKVKGTKIFSAISARFRSML